VDFHRLEVAQVDRVCADAVAVTFSVPPALAAAYEFRAGQSLTLRRGDERRSYSICAPEGAPPRIGVREVPGGLFSSWLVNEVNSGDEIDVGTPTGAFSPEPEPAHHVLIAAGSGITPVLSIASTVLRDPRSTAILLYGNRRADTVMFADELADLKDRWLSRFELVHVLSREPREADLCTGRLDPARLAALVPAPDEVDHWWLCGPFAVVTGARTLLLERGVPTDRVHQELFHVDEPPPPVRHEEAPLTAPTSEATVVLDGRATTVTLPRDVSLLAGAQRVRPDLPFACKGGVCGTCRAKVTSGKADLRRNFALDQSEVDNGFILTCQSFPVSDRLTVDFDA
jgi:ring-1,2-phenylacetyl-CoA epoxidase subunit PaaE